MNGRPGGRFAVPSPISRESRRPEARTDVLGKVLASVRAGHADACHLKVSGAWGERYPQVAGSAFRIVLRGNAWLIAASGPARALKVGDVVIVPFGAAHGLAHAPVRLERLPLVGDREPTPAGNAEVEVLSGAYRLDGGQVPPYLRTLPELIVVSPDYDESPTLRSLVQLLASEVAQEQPGVEVTRPALLDLLLTQMLRYWLASNQDAHLPDVSDAAVATVLAAIHASPDRPWTVEQFSAMAGLSRGVFTRRFTALVGQAPSAYLTGWRLAKAAQLLRETKAPLAAIARQVGYSTEFALGAAFRRQYGISPGRFRKLDPSLRRTVTEQERDAQ